MLGKLRNSETLSFIKSSIKNGLFCPFLGAGASALRPDPLDLTATPWKEIAERLVLLYKDSDEETQSYLRSFSKQRLNLDTEQINVLFSNNAQVTDADGFASFQLLLVKTIAQLTKAFGEGFAKTFQTVSNPIDASVPYDSAQQAESFGALIATITKLIQIKTDNPFCPGKIYFNGILGKLLTLIFLLASESTRKTDPFKSFCAQYKKNIVACTTQDDILHADTSLLRIEYLEWLSDLFWYTLSYWISHYPTAKELSFELSLYDIYSPPITPDLAQVAEGLQSARGDKTGEQYLASLLEPYIRYWEEHNKTPLKFHGIITTILYYHYELYKSCSMDARQSAGWKHPYPLPVLFTTNFDQAVEKHFDRCGITYHIVLPVTKANHVGRWKFLTCANNQIIDSVPCNSAISVNEILSKPLLGPIVVKLHGSPLTPLSDAEHGIVLSESDYLKSMINSGPMPEFVEGAFMGRREIWFLGYSMSDWNIKLRLYQNQFASGNPQAGGDGESFQSPKRNSTNASKTNEEKTVHIDIPQVKCNKHSLVKRFSPYRIAIFNKLNIALYDGDIHSLTDILYQDLCELIKEISEGHGNSPFAKKTSKNEKDLISNNMKKLLD